MIDSQSHPRRWWILAVLCLSLLVLGIDALIVQVALPTIQRDLDASATALQWIIDSYILAFAGLLGLAGGLVDRFGHRRALLVGYVVFLAASIGAALSGSTEVLVSFRALMGVGGTLIMPATLAIIRDVFAERERAQAIGAWAAMAAVGIPLGPVAGGLLLEHYDWGAIFLVNIPIVAIAFAGVWLLVPVLRSAGRTRLDVPGAALSVAGLVALVWAIIEAPERGYTDPAIVLAFVAAVVLLVGFWLVENRVREPLLPPSLARSRAFGGPFLAITLLAFGLFGVVFLLTQYFQFVRGLDPFPAGLRMLAIATIVLGAPTGAAVAARIGPRWPVTAGLVIVATGLALGATADADSEALVVLALAIVGPGMGLVMAPAANAVLAAAPKGKGGIGSAAAETALQLGGALGVAVLGSVLSATYTAEVEEVTGQLPPGEAAAAEDSIGAALAIADRIGQPEAGQLVVAAQDAFVAGQGTAMLIAAAVALVGAGFAALALPRHHRTSDSAADGGAGLPAALGHLRDEAR